MNFYQTINFKSTIILVFAKAFQKKNLFCGYVNRKHIKTLLPISIFFSHFDTFPHTHNLH